MSETLKPTSEHDALLKCIEVLKRIMRDDLLCGEGRCLLTDGVVERPLFGCARDALLNAEIALNRRAAPAIPASVVESLQSENAALRAKLETERQERIAAMVSAEGARKDAEMLARLIEELVLKHRAKNSCKSCKHFDGGHGGANCIRCKRISQDRFEQAPADGAGKGE